MRTSWAESVLVWITVTSSPSSSLSLVSTSMLSEGSLSRTVLPLDITAAGAEVGVTDWAELTTTDGAGVELVVVTGAEAGG